MASAAGTRFSPARLSPVPVEPVQVPLPFGLTWPQLQPCLPGFTTAVGARALRTHRLQGLRDESASAVVTLDYPSVDPTDGDRAQLTVFVKRTDRTVQEAAKLRHLAAHGVGVPRVLRLVASADTHVLVLEFLPHIGIEPADAGDVDAVLDLMARLHCVDPGPGVLFDPRPGMPAAEFDAGVRAALARLAADPSVDVPVDPTDWFDAYARVRRRVARLPREVNHGEFYFQQVGRRSGADGAALVLFDTATTALLPRFTDLAFVLADLAGSNGAEHDVFLRYLAARQAISGQRMPPESGWGDLLAVRLLTSFEGLPWLLAAQPSSAPAHTPTEVAGTMAADMVALRVAGPGRGRPTPATGH